MFTGDEKDLCIETITAWTTDGGANSAIDKLQRQTVRSQVAKLAQCNCEFVRVRFH